MNNINLVVVIKAVYDFKQIVNVFQYNGITSLGISKISISRELCRTFTQLPILISLPLPNDANDVVSFSKVSFNSELVTIKALSDAAQKKQKLHQIMLLVELGDLREGVLPEDVLDAVRVILPLQHKYFKLVGLASNLGCNKCTLPTKDNLQLLNDLSLDIEKYFGFHIERVSIGGSVILGWMQSNKLPFKINELRIGESIFLGSIPCFNTKKSELYDDALYVTGQVLEIKKKPNLYFYSSNEVENYELQAIINFGSVDISANDLVPYNKNIKITGQTSDYTLLKIINNDSFFLRIGDTLKFKLNYTAMSRAFLSPNIRKSFLS